MIALAGAEASFARAAGLLAGLAGITVSPRTIERSAEATGAAARAAAETEAAAIRARTIIPLPPAEPVPDMLYAETDGTGVPVRASETEGRPGKGEDGKAGTREVKLARFFTVSHLDEDGRPVMDPGSSTYVATFGGKDALAGLVEAEYLRRGGEHFRQVVALGDGAAWIWTMAGKLYPHATHIVDIYHAREHLTDLANHLAFITPDPAQWLAGRNEELDAGEHRGDHRRRPRLPARRHQGQRPGQEARLLRAQHPPDALRSTSRDLGMFIGSGAIEGGIKAIVVQRAKQSGMHWTVEGAADIIALRTQHASGRWDELGAARADGPDAGYAPPSDRPRDSDPQEPRPGQDHLQQS